VARLAYADNSLDLIRSRREAAKSLLGWRSRLPLKCSGGKIIHNPVANLRKG